MESESLAHVADEVFDQLSTFSAPGGVLDIDGPRASVNVMGSTGLARRQFDVARWYIARQTAVATEGRVAVVTAGPPGSGKTTLLKAEGFLGGEFRNIDSDIIKDELLRRDIRDGLYSDLLAEVLADDRNVAPRELSSLVHHESTAIAHAVMVETLRRGENVIIQGTLGWDGQPAILLDALEGADYQELTIVDVEAQLVDVEDRTKQRWWLSRVNPSEPLGGRFVAIRSLARLYREDGRSVCGENAKVMLELSRSRLPATLLTVDGVSRVTTTNLPSADLDLIDEQN